MAENRLHTVLRNYGGQLQVRLESASDLEAAAELDDACWMVTSSPADALNCDAAFLKFLDTDNDSRVRTDEMRQAIRWALEMLADRSGLDQGSDILKLDAINSANPEGEKLKAAAVQVLENLGLEDKTEISLAQVRDMKKIRANSVSNGDGVVTPTAAESAEVADFIRNVMDTVGSVPDACGEAGVSEAELANFRKEAEAYLAWEARGHLPEGEDSSEVMVWGANTAAASAAVEAIRPKIDEYFSQCRLAAVDLRTADHAGLSEEAIKSLDYTDQAALEARLKSLPLARPQQKPELDLCGPLNPAYAGQIRALRDRVLDRALGRDCSTLTQAEWLQVVKLFEPYRAWCNSKQGTSVEKLGVERIRQLLDSDLESQVKALIAKDKAVADELAGVANVEKLILYQQGLLRLANNYISLSYLYNPEEPSLFQKGRLVMNGTLFTFNVEVKKSADHKKLAQNSQIYVMYVKVDRTSENASFEVATAVTAGDARGLHKGRKGIFITPDGKVWDAELTDIIVNPVSLWEAVKAPFVQLGQFLEKQADKFTSSRVSEMEKRVQAGVTSVDKTVQQGIQEVSKTPPDAGAARAEATRSGAMRDIMVGGSVAIAALGSALAFITKTLSQVKWWQLPAGVLAVLVVTVVPLIILGMLKLRRRNISPILEASGWAINADLRITASMGHLFTRPGLFPEDASIDHKDITRRYAKELGYHSKLLRAGLVLLVAVLFFLAGAHFSQPVSDALAAFLNLSR